MIAEEFSGRHLGIIIQSFARHEKLLKNLIWSIGSVILIIQSERNQASRENKYSKDWALALQQPKRNGKELMKKKPKSLCNLRNLWLFLRLECYNNPLSKFPTVEFLTLLLF